MSKLLWDSLISGGIPTIVFILKSIWDNKNIKEIWNEINAHIEIDHAGQWTQKELPKIICKFCSDKKTIPVTGQNGEEREMPCPACTKKKLECTCIEGNHPALATTSVQDCKLHGMSPMHTNQNYAKSGVPVPHCDEHEIPMHQECLKNKSAFHNVSIPTTNPAISYIGGAYPPNELQNVPEPVSKYPSELTEAGDAGEEGDRSYLFRDQT